MKKTILNLGKALTKTDQKKINGGNSFCNANGDCPSGFYCDSYICVSDGSGGGTGGGNGGGCTFMKIFCESYDDTCCLYF